MKFEVDPQAQLETQQSLVTSRRDRVERDQYKTAGRKGGRRDW